jgi:hypothetical protein
MQEVVVVTYSLDRLKVLAVKVVVLMVHKVMV